MNLGRNELCSCGSGKKYKRCCISKEVPPQKSEQQEDTESGASGMEAGSNPFFQQMYQKMSESGKMEEMTRAMKGLPKSQLFQMAKIIQKGMAGKDITQEWQAIQAKLPPSFQETMQTLSQNAMLSSLMEQGSQAASEAKEEGADQKPKNWVSGLWDKLKKKS